MADNTLQFCWIVVLFGNLAALFRDLQDVFVSGNQNWYPVEGHPEIVNAPDVYVVFGRPKGHRSSWKQWEEDDTPLTVVFEVLSPENTSREMDEKFLFYEEHGVEEYDVYDPDPNRLKIYLRKGQTLVRERAVNGFVSPRLKIRFDLSGPELMVYGPDGERFLTFEELRKDQVQQRLRADRAEQRADRLAELSRKARRGLATPEELQELDRLEGPPS
jgi:Uma2 family endonuclease